MKKLTTLLVMLLFTAGMAIGQNTANTSQSGNGNDSTIDQVGAQNLGETEQDGNGNDASLVQLESSNDGGIHQIGNDNNSEMLQDGINNEGFSLQGFDNLFNANRNESNLEQNGNNNLGIVYQFYGVENESEVNQSGNQNTAYVIQGWNNARINLYDVVNRNDAVINQNTSNSDARIFKYDGDDNVATVTQDGGNFNNGQISQGYLWNMPAANASVANDNEGYIDQLGDLNNATVMQLGNNNFFNLVQNGTGNTVGEEGRVSTGSVWFKQRGDRNEFVGVNQGSNSLSLALFSAAEQNNGATLDFDSEGITGYYGSFQIGNDNRIGLRQGNNDVGQIQQLGNSNTSLLYQVGAESHSATILQDGNSNTASVSQTSN